jgi:Zn-dependent peptidase ImmA (M78 family)/transcriptional regulator with XRE-family HTH domain
VGARQAIGLSRSEAATQLGVTDGLLEAIEKGEEYPNSYLFNAMITVYKQPESTLLLAKPPDTAELPQDYRTPAGRRKKLSPETRLIIREAQELQRYVSELAEDDPALIKRFELPKATLSNSAANLAKTERARLGVSLSTQLKWRPLESFNRWRNWLQDKGIIVLLKRMPWDECRGFSLLDTTLIPTIVVNSEDVVSARTFTLFHEYAHLMLRHSGVCTLAPDVTVEQWCNVFSASFLLPADELTSYIKHTYAEAGPNYNWPIPRLTRLAGRYRVSRAVMALRLQKLGLATPNYFESHYAELNAFDRRPKPKEPPHIIKKPGWREKQRLNEVGLIAASVIVEAWREDITDATEAADILNLSLDELHGLQVQTEVQRVRNVS